MAGHGRSMLGGDGKPPAGTTRHALGSGGKRAFKEGLDSPGPTGRNAKSAAAKSATKTYFVENLPGILDAKGFPLGASFMRFWVEHKGNQKGAGTGPIHRTRALDHDHLKGWTHATKHPLEVMKTQRPWLDKRKDELIERIKRRWRTSRPAGGVLAFPDPRVSNPPALAQKSGAGLPYNEPTNNDATWADEVDFWGLWNPEGASDGAGIFSMALATLDDYAYGLGCFDWYILPKGAAAFVPSAGGGPDRMTVTISEIGVYAVDSYDFNGGQFLGVWNVETQDVKKISLAPWPFLPSEVPDDGLYRADLGWTNVRNKSFANYRAKTGNGCDFLVYSDVKFTPIQGGSFTFDMT